MRFSKNMSEPQIAVTAAARSGKKAAENGSLYVALRKSAVTFERTVSVKH